MTTATHSREHTEAYLTTQERFRASCRTAPKPRQFAKRAADDTREPLDILKEFGPFTVSDLAAVSGYTWGQAKTAISELLREQRIEVGADGWRYEVVVQPCRALVPVTECHALVVYEQAAPQFATRFIRYLVHEQHQSPAEFDPPAPMGWDNPFDDDEPEQALVEYADPVDLLCQLAFNATIGRGMCGYPALGKQIGRAVQEKRQPGLTAQMEQWERDLVDALNRVDWERIAKHVIHEDASATLEEIVEWSNFVK